MKTLMTMMGWDDENKCDKDHIKSSPTDVLGHVMCVDVSWTFWSYTTATLGIEWMDKTIH